MNNIIMILFWIILLINIVSIDVIHYGVNAGEGKTNKIFEIIFSIIFIISIFGFFYFAFKKSYLAILMILIIIVAMVIKIKYNDFSTTYSAFDIIGTFAAIYFIMFTFIVTASSSQNISIDIKSLIPLAIAILSQCINYNIILSHETNNNKSISIKVYLALFIFVAMFITYSICFTNSYLGKYSIYILFALIVIGILSYIGFTWGTTPFSGGGDNGTPTQIPKMDPLIADPEVNQDTLNKIIKNLNNFYTNDNCYVGDGSCNYLFTQLVNGKITKYSELMAILDPMEKDALINQNIFLMYNLLQCKILLKDYKTHEVVELGTLDWIVQKFFNNSFQIFIYIMSLLLMFAFIVVSCYQFVNNNFLTSISPTGIKNLPFSLPLFIGFTIIITIIYLVLFGIMGKDQNVTIYDVPNKLRKYIFKETDAGRVDESPSSSPNDTDVSKSSLALKWMMPILLIGLSVVTFLTGNDILKTLNMSAWIGLLLALNILYSFFIPQIMLIGTLLQKFILMFPLSEIRDLNDLAVLIGKGIIFIVILVTSLYSTQYTSSTSMADNETTNVPTASANLFIWLLFGITVSFYGTNIIESFLISKPSQLLNSREYALVLMPLFSHILDFANSTNKSIEYTTSL